MSTLIELFDECQTENVIASLFLKPERIVFVGFKESMSLKRRQAIETFYASRGEKTELQFEVVGRYDIGKIEEKIISATEKYPDCIIDITGGKEAILAAIGRTVAEKNIPVVQFNSKNKLEFLNRDATVSKPDAEAVNISLHEMIALNGGSVISKVNVPLSDSEFVKDVEKAWEIAKKGCGNWNRQATAFGNFEKYGVRDGLFVKADINEFKRVKKEFYLNNEVINALALEGLIYGYEERGGKVSFCYKNDNVRRLLTKAGNVLEFYSYIKLAEIKGKINDSAVGVTVDWDGVSSGGAETRNEIDIMLMKDAVPVFISCKNGEVYKEALYELDSLARRFGGSYAEKVMFATYLSGDDDKKAYLISRAKDMGINLIYGIEKMEKEEFFCRIKEVTI